MNLEQFISKINTRQDLISFVKALKKDLKENPNEWENHSLEHYLDSIAGWLEDMDGYYKNLGQAVPNSKDWKLFADILLAGKSYE